ncbi:hypothetical protein T484DRAFT_1747636 [Baffinella frigidus]|nr:hypothetical protein T484DRAFT_1747636 [Cryptophyta sp. CCMP2293]
MCGKEECGSTCKPASPARVSTKRKRDDVADSTPTPFSTTQPEDIVTPTETMSSVDDDDTTSSTEMDGDDTTSSTEMEEETTEDCGEDDAKKKKKKPAVRKHKCTKCDVSKRSPGELKAHADFEHNGIYHNVCDLIDKKTGKKCGFMCEQRGHLTLHKNSLKHSDDGVDVRKYPCPDCEKPFNTADTRKQHWDACCSPPGDPVRTQVKCPVCNMGFPTQAQCIDHHLRRCVPKDDPRLIALHERDNKAKKALYASDEIVRAKKALRAALGRMMKKMGMRKVSLSEEVVGCSYEELIAHLNDNDHGYVYDKSGGEFHIDHIRPMASFKNLATCHLEVLECMDFNNLQLLPGPENKRKGDRFNAKDKAAYAVSKGGMAIAERREDRIAAGVCKCKLCVK